MKNCTNHFNLRWTERIVGIEGEKEIKDYVAKNKDLIYEHANKTFEFATFIYKGQIGDNVTRNYHIKDNIIFVTNTSDDAFITTYKIDFGLPEDLNVTIRKRLIEEIEKLRNEKEDIELKILEEVEDKEHEIETTEDNIKILEEQISNFRKQKEFLQNEVKSIKSRSLNVGLELKKYTLMLVNSKDYKKDLTTLK
ncbi:coiled-coil domain-containing protein [Bacillus licheniformis]|uniref:coiled-coil domain-containing protein n=1 Tax=Bacillus licheniformis TaxID=1402 RepID=UPI000929CC8D|nr:hypothetical protein [Bacillus licheniformis]OJT57413.1 hypothetical protein BFP47_11960 [Bacillus licheniformis]OJT69945.1 hypothetical protein BFP46_04930 [Bacillus licheniformis]